MATMIRFLLALVLGHNLFSLVGTALANSNRTSEEATEVSKAESNASAEKSQEQIAKEMCSTSDPNSALNLARFQSSGAVLEVICAINFDLLPYYGTQLSLFESSSLNDLSLDVAFAISNLPNEDFNSVILMLLESYRLEGHPGIEVLIGNISAFIRPEIKQQRRRSSTVTFLDNTMVWGTAFLFAGRGIPWFHHQIKNKSWYPWKDLKWSWGNGAKSTSPSSSKEVGFVKNNPVGDFKGTPDLLNGAIPNLLNARSMFYRAYAGGALMATQEEILYQNRVKKLDVPNLFEYIQIDMICEMAVTASKLQSVELFDTNAQAFVLYSQSRLKNFAPQKDRWNNFIPAQRLDENGLKGSKQLEDWSNIYSFYAQHRKECARLSIHVIQKDMAILMNRLVQQRKSAQVSKTTEAP